MADKKTLLKVTKSDKTVHTMPNTKDNKAFLQHYNLRVAGSSRQLKVEEITEKEAENLPFFDESHVTAAEAQAKVPDMQKRIEELEAELAKRNAPPAETAKQKAEREKAEKEAAEAAAKNQTNA